VIKRLLASFLLLVLLTACVLTGPEPASDKQNEWWREAVFYEIFVRSFYDTDDDGIGDFNGITQKLDYLQDLGITAIWLMPIQPSPSYHGYDVLNYYNVNPEYGTVDDFKHLLDEAHQRDIRIIIDLVINHTSSQHPFFIEANNNPSSHFREWYIWSDTDLGNNWHPGNQGYYYGLFCDCMPDLNYRNPEVTAQFKEVTRYWIDEIGVDGFRLDAAKHLIEEGDVTENTQATHDWYRDYYTFYKSVDPGAYTVGEVFGAGAFIATTYENQLDQIFNFELANGMMNSVNGGSKTGIHSAWKFTLAEIDDGDYATFLTNHDQDRVMSVLNGNQDKAKLAAFLLLTLPGTPFIYYGEEVGMQGQKPDEDIRLPMQWNANENSGFSTGNPWRAPHSQYLDINVAAQENDPDSLLNHYRKLIQLRKELSILRTGELSLLETGNSGVYGVLRTEGDEHILALANLTDAPISEYALSLEESMFLKGDITPRALFGSARATPVNIKNGKFTGYKPLDELPPYQAYLFQFK